MSAMTATLPRIWPSPGGTPLPPTGMAEVFRAFACDLAAARRAWDARTARFIAGQFDELPGEWDTSRATGHDDPLRDALNRGGERLLALVATCAYWGDDETDRWWIGGIEQLAEPNRDGGLTSLLNLVRAPATMVIYAAGVASLAAERWRTLARILTEPHTPDPYTDSDAVPVAVLLGPADVLSLRKSSERLYQQLQPVFTDHLALSQAAYTDAWERFEYLRLIAVYAAGRSLNGAPHMRRTGGLDTYQPLPAAWLERQVARLGEGHPLLRAGFLDGHTGDLTAAHHRLVADFSKWSSRVAWGGQQFIKALSAPGQWGSG
ncbi:hypothetical protein [Streptomyces mirabilis]|uniref:hypothetical protein n=1 Tax=Streptomyces mirabilis TaxID=68239 RepID=UPI0021C173A2|nr:hypothetical protein [Streptomyces mirabilis]MCT9113313.1 hypothetical protein [Streptomyces mirabilis]